MSLDNIPWTSTSDDFDELWEDLPNPPDSVPDILETMFAQQLGHMRAYADIHHTTPDVPEGAYGSIDSPLVQAKIRETAGYVTEELYEAVGLLKNKPWKQTFREPDREAFLEEIADVWHFFIELHLVAGISAEEVFRQYFRKTLINEQRRASDY
ncbi:nucleotide pyrophosphohydrolase [Gordonia phage Mayweather]|uniref:MazG-like nucleotide pyrophosphohydrolase n=1 Tax=Gordonia phage Mayweather TaxID=2590931 RepID=A0A516KU65_9CAUD|nr:nucleotide pyrophosphohydrolase [Gordonia phage Mayweather]QDP45220.1 dUTPase [Gordonia phage Mayweather]